MLIKLTRYDGMSIWVNTSHIVSVRRVLTENMSVSKNGPRWTDYGVELTYVELYGSHLNNGEIVEKNRVRVKDLPEDIKREWDREL